MGWDLGRRVGIKLMHTYAWLHDDISKAAVHVRRAWSSPIYVALTYDPTESVHASRMAKTTLQQPTAACMCVCACTTTLFLPLLGPLICSFRPRALKPTLEPSTAAILPAACNANICDVWRYVHWSSTGVCACIYQLQVASCFLHLVVPTNLGHCNSQASTVPHAFFHEYSATYWCSAHYRKSCMKRLAMLFVYTLSVIHSFSWLGSHT
jgi:hypothetical protein